eukprot:TRINITY_DN13516_c0_g1_i1.p1 TRINITY_DN13516_c0_g1~~TRINITY_DN13516_c0_g1_i1.p1  ORF type:complete len:209 (+),score=30.05 TRINITY_DN13516_c0_g1_i1:53-679(+)
MAGLVVTPLACYHRDGTLFRGIAQALQHFASTVCLEAVDLTANASATTQSLLEKTVGAMSPVRIGRPQSKYAGQPATAAEGLSQAYSALARGLKAAARAVSDIPEIAPRDGYMVAGLHAIPVVVLNPHDRSHGGDVADPLRPPERHGPPPQGRHGPHLQTRLTPSPSPCPPSPPHVRRLAAPAPRSPLAGSVVFARYRSPVFFPRCTL